MKAFYKPHSIKLLFKPGMSLMVIAVISLMLSACNLGSSPATLDASSLSTYVYQTADAKMTQDAFTTLVDQVTQAALPSITQPAQASPQSSSTPIPSTATDVPATQTTAPTQPFTTTPIPPTATNTPIPVPADWAQFVTDVSVPDGTTLNIGASFTKTWRLKNIGSTTWTTDYTIVFVSNDSIGAQKVINLTGDVARGAQIDLSVAMVAPTTPGYYQGSWMLRNASGKLFGLGPQADQPFWVRISVAPQPIPVDRAQFITDVSVPDGTSFTEGTSFTKTWRLKNIGSTTWTTNYAIVFVSNDSIGAQKVINLTGDVARGAQIDLSVAMVAPTTPGYYQGSWMLRNASGKLFGLGPQADQPFWVRISVANAETAVYNFVTNYCARGVTWVNGSFPPPLPCPGAAGSTDGSIQNVSNPRLEDSSISAYSALRVEPQHVANGFIEGSYPAFSVQSGDHFKTVIGCAWNKNCDIVFYLHIKIGNGPEQSLGAWEEINDHMIRYIDVDLTSLAGQNVVFILKAVGKNANSQNVGLWLNPRIVR